MGEEGLVVEQDDLPPPNNMRFPCGNLVTGRTELAEDLPTDQEAYFLAYQIELTAEHVVDRGARRPPGVGRFALAETFYSQVCRVVEELQYSLQGAALLVPGRQRYFHVDPENSLLSILEGCGSLLQLNAAWGILRRRLDLGREFVKRYVKELYMLDAPKTFTPACTSAAHNEDLVKREQGHDAERESHQFVDGSTKKLLTNKNHTQKTFAPPHTSPPHPAPPRVIDRDAVELGGQEESSAVANHPSTNESTHKILIFHRSPAPSPLSPAPSSGTPASTVELGGQRYGHLCASDRVMAESGGRSDELAEAHKRRGCVSEDEVNTPSTIEIGGLEDTVSQGCQSLKQKTRTVHVASPHPKHPETEERDESKAALDKGIQEEEPVKSNEQRSDSSLTDDPYPRLVGLSSNTIERPTFGRAYLSSLAQHAMSLGIDKAPSPSYAKPFDWSPADAEECASRLDSNKLCWNGAQKHNGAPVVRTNKSPVHTYTSHHRVERAVVVLRSTDADPVPAGTPRTPSNLIPDMSWSLARREQESPLPSHPNTGRDEGALPKIELGGLKGIGNKYHPAYTNKKTQTLERARNSCGELALNDESVGVSPSFKPAIASAVKCGGLQIALEGLLVAHNSREVDAQHEVAVACEAVEVHVSEIADAGVSMPMWMTINSLHIRCEEHDAGLAWERRGIKSLAAVLIADVDVVGVERRTMAMEDLVSTVSRRIGWLGVMKAYVELEEQKRTSAGCKTVSQNERRTKDLDRDQIADLENMTTSSKSPPPALAMASTVEGGGLRMRLSNELPQAPLVGPYGRRDAVVASSFKFDSLSMTLPSSMNVLSDFGYSVLVPDDAIVWTNRNADLARNRREDGASCLLWKREGIGTCVVA